MQKYIYSIYKPNPISHQNVSLYDCLNLKYQFMFKKVYFSLYKDIKGKATLFVFKILLNIYVILQILVLSFSQISVNL